MLAQLTVRNVVLIERLALELASGFNVVTGETGAGKSMVVDALSLALGGRARPDLVRAGATEAEVEALFELPSEARVVSRLAAAGIPAEKELVVRRVVQAEGRSRAYVNGRLCTAAQLAEVAADLCDIASQHESVSLTDPSTHVEYLDAFGKLEPDRAHLAELVDALAEVTRELETASTQERGRAEREDFLRWQLREIDELDPRDGEETELEHERGRLRHAEKLQTATRRAAERLYEGESTICDELGRLGAELDQAAGIDGSLTPLARAVESARAELSDAARALARYAEGVEASPERLAEVEERAFRLQKLLRKHGPATSDLLAHRSTVARELASLASASDRVADLEAEKARRVSEAGAVARALSRKRKDAAERLAESIGRELSQQGDRMLLHVFGHVDAQQRTLIVEKKLGKGASQFSFSHASWTEKNKRTNRALGVAESGAGAADRVGHAFESLVLADDAMAKTVFHGDQLFHLAFEHLGDRNAGPLGDDAGDIFFVDFFFQHARRACGFVVDFGRQLF